jgi:hypothetical protein
VVESSGAIGWFPLKNIEDEVQEQDSGTFIGANREKTTKSLGRRLSARPGRDFLEAANILPSLTSNCGLNYEAPAQLTLSHSAEYTPVLMQAMKTVEEKKRRDTISSILKKNEHVVDIAEAITVSI